MTERNCYGKEKRLGPHSQHRLNARTAHRQAARGYQNDAAEIGDEVTIRTATGREERGTLVEVNPCYALNYGTFVPEILTMEESLRKALFGGEEA